MNIHNMTLDELYSQAMHDDNTLALVIADKTKEAITKELEESNDELKIWIKENIEKTIESCVDEYLTTFQKDNENNYMFVQSVEDYAYLLNEYIEYTLTNDELVSHIDDYLSETRWHYPDYPTEAPAFKNIIWHIDEQMADIYCKFTDCQIEKLKELCILESNMAFDVDNINSAYNVTKDYIYTINFSEESYGNLQDHLEIFLPDCISSDDLNCNNCYITDDGEIMVEMYDMGLGWSINLQWLEGVIARIHLESQEESIND